jgi:hypothetical protein
MTKTVFAAAGVYWVIVFALGFVLGTLRVIVLAPKLGELTATLVELPIMLGASWFICAWVVRRWAVSAKPWPRLVMGTTAFGLLIAAEILLGVVGFGRTAGDQIAEMSRGAGLLGVVGQLGFAAFPWLQLGKLR